MEHQTNTESDLEQCAWLEALLNKETNDRSVARVVKVEVKGAVPEGVNYASIISRATLTVILRNGHKRKLSLIIKKAHLDEGKAKALADIPVFKSEIAVYGDILQKFEYLMAEYQDADDKPWCNMIGYMPNHTIVFEDLSARNFMVADRVALLDYNHGALVLHNLGRFHAVGHVLMKKGMIVKGDAPPYYPETDSVVISNIYEGTLGSLSRVIDEFWSDEWKEIGKSVNKQSKIAKNKLRDLLQKFGSDESCFLTFCHGDCWTCNMMFKYCPYDRSYPVAHKFLDFQSCHINCYIFDVIHFLFSSVKLEVRHSKLKDLLNVYWKSLKSTLAIYGLEDEAPSLTRLEEDYKNTLYYSFIVFCIMLPISATDNPFKLELLNEGMDPAEAFDLEVYKKEFVKLSLQLELKEFFKQGVF